MQDDNGTTEPGESEWVEPAPGQLIAAGHGAGDILGADTWEIIEERPGLLAVKAHLPDRLKNPQGQLFGGFTPTYVDMVSLFTVRAGESRSPHDKRNWLTTINMRCDYFEPIVDDHFIIKGEVIKRRGLTTLVSASFLQDDVMAAHAITTLREIPSV